MLSGALYIGGVVFFYPHIVGALQRWQGVVTSSTDQQHDSPRLTLAGDANLKVQAVTLDFVARRARCD